MVRKVCINVRQDSPGKVERSELMLWVATIGMHLACRESAKNFSSPVGSFSPTVAKAWIFIAKKEDFPPVAIGVRFHARNAVQHRALEVLFHQSADGAWPDRD